jgi:lysozyme
MTITRIYGPDVSFYQDDNNTPQRIDFQKMKAAGATFVIIRAGQNIWEDEDFKYNYRASKEAGLPRGIYFFYDDRAAPEVQAALCLSLVGLDYPELGIWLDIEKDYGGPYKGWQNWKLCLNRLKQAPIKVGVYTGPYYWMARRPAGGADLAYFKSFPLWIAHYGVASPDIPYPWTSAVLWQYGTPTVGLEYGVESLEIDMNYFSGDLESFNSYFGISGGVITPPQEGNNMIMYGQVLTNLRIRNVPNSLSDSNIVGQLAPNDLVEGDNNFNGWWHLTKWTRGTTAMTLPAGDCWAYEGVTNGYIKPVAPPATSGHIVELYVDGVLKYREELA